MRKLRYSCRVSFGNTNSLKGEKGGKGRKGEIKKPSRRYVGTVLRNQKFKGWVTIGSTHFSGISPAIFGIGQIGQTRLVFRAWGE